MQRAMSCCKSEVSSEGAPSRSGHDGGALHRGHGEDEQPSTGGVCGSRRFTFGCDLCVSSEACSNVELHGLTHHQEPTQTHKWGLRMFIFVRYSHLSSPRLSASAYCIPALYGQTNWVGGCEGRACRWQRWRGRRRQRRHSSGGGGGYTGPSRPVRAAILGPVLEAAVRRPEGSLLCAADRPDI